MFYQKSVKEKASAQVIAFARFVLWRELYVFAFSYMDLYRSRDKTFTCMVWLIKIFIYFFGEASFDSYVPIHDLFCFHISFEVSSTQIE